MLAEFGFRGAEFGLWTNDGDRQQSLNQAFDGLHDLARILNVPPKALSLNGELGIAFGARGSGKFAAHYEPSRIVINLTKTSGAGALAHEWAHAMDDYFGRMATSGQSGKYVSHGAKGTEAFRAELAATINEVMKAISERQWTAPEYIADLKERNATAQKKTDSWLKSVERSTAKVELTPEQKDEVDTYTAQLRGQRMPEALVNGRPDMTQVATKMLAIIDSAAKAQKIRVDWPVTGGGKMSDLAAGLGRHSGMIFATNNDLARAEAGDLQVPNRTVPTNTLKASQEQGDYWQRKHELFARSFEAFIEDSIRREGNQSPYLVGFTADSGSWGNLYPQGDERAATNEAFQKMVDALKTRETDKGVALFASPTAPARPIASVIQSFEAAFPTFSTYMDENQTPAVRKEALRKIVKAESADVQAWREFANLDPEQALPEDAEAIREAKELLPEVESMQDVQAATGQSKVSIPDLHAAFVTAKRQQGTDSPTIRAVFDAAKVKNPRLSRQEFVQAIRNGHYTGLVTLRDGQGSIQVGGKGAMSLLPITEAEIMDAADNATETPEAILADWAATEDVQQAPAQPLRPRVTHEMPDGYQLTEEGMQPLMASPTVRAYHGTPHKVDKFTTAKIGTGEGAQAYGWGLYFAENQGVARDYQNRLVANKPDSFAIITLDGVELPRKWSELLEVVTDADERDAIRGIQESGLSYTPTFGSDAKNKKVAAALEKLRGRVAIKQPAGNLYTVELLPDADEFLDWDKPLSEQSEKVREALARLSTKQVSADGLDMGGGSFIRDNRMGQFDKSKPYPWLLVSGKSVFGLSQADVDRMTKEHANPTGENVYSRLTASEGSQKSASDKLASLGIPGIRYLDGGSRGAGDGTRNYVIFDENLVRILEENGKPVDQEPLQASPTASRDVARHAELEAKHNAGTITPEETAEAQRMVDEAAKAAGYNVGPVLHSSESDFDVFNDKVQYFSSDPTYPRLSKGIVRPFHLSIRNPKSVKLEDIEGLNLPGVNDAAKAKSDGFDAFIYQPSENVDKFSYERHPQIAVFDSNQIKSADPFTGVPLDERFNPASDSILYATPTDKKPRRRTVDPSVANPGDSKESRDAFDAIRSRYVMEDLTQANFNEIRTKVAEALDTNEADILDNLLYKVENELELRLEEEVARRMLSNRLRKRGLQEGNAELVKQADILMTQDMTGRTEIARKLAIGVDQFQTPQERLDSAIGHIIAPNRAHLRERLVNVWSPAAKRREIARLEAEIAQAKTDLSRAKLERTLAEAKARQDHADVMQKVVEENNAKIDAILKRNGLTQTDLFLSVDDRYAMQEAVLEMTRAHMGQQSAAHKKAIEMSVRGYSDAAISKETGLPLAEVSNTAEHFRNVVAKQAIAKEVGKGGTFSKIVQEGKKLISWILQASPTAPLGSMVAKGTPTAAAVAAQIQAILNASIPTKGQRNAMTFHAATAKGKNGQNVKVFVPYDPADWKQVYRTARELSTREATWLDKGYEYWINGILSGPQTHVVNTASNVLSTAWAYGPQWFAEATANVLIRNPNSPQLGEFKHVWAGFYKGIMPALRNFALAWSTEADPVEHQYLDKPVTAMFQGGNLDKVGGIRPSIGGTFGRIVRVSGRFLVAQDAFAKTLIMHAESAAMAYRLGKKQDLEGAALTNFIAKQVATHGSESWQHAFEKAVELTFQDENDITKAVESVSNALKRAKLVGWLFKFMLPFVRTPTNIYRAGIRKAGGSAGMLLYRLGKSGYYAIKGNNNEFRSYREGKMVKDVSETVMALVLWYFIMGMSEGDDDDNQKAIEITGSRPFGVANAGERASQLRQEGGSNLVIIRKNPLTGEKLDEPLRLPYGRYEPIALAVSTLVDGVREFKEWSRLKPQDRTTNALAGSISKHLLAQAKDKTFLQGISGFMDFLEDMGGKNLSLQDIAMKNLFNGAIPNLIRQPYRNIQDTIADSKKADSELSRSLGIGEAKVNEAGKPVTRQGNIVSRVLFPVPTTPSTSLFDSALKKWNASNPGQQWNPDPLTKGDWFVYDPKLGSQKGKVALTDSRQISLFETMVGLKFASLAARALVKEGYRPGQPVTPKMFEAIKDARTEAITKTRQRHPSEFRTSKP